MKVEFGENADKVSLNAIAEQIVQLHQKADEVYLPLVEDVCSRSVSEDELSHLLDYLLDFACDEKVLRLYKKDMWKIFGCISRLYWGLY